MLGGLHAAVVVVDEELRVQIWNRHAEDLWGLRAAEAEGRNLLNLDIGLPVDRLRQPIRQMLQDGTLEGRSVLTVQATNRRGQAIQCRISCSPMGDKEGAISGIILLMEETAVQ